MIYYNSGSLWSIFLRWNGSALNGPAVIRALLMALFAMGVATANAHYNFMVVTTVSTAFSGTIIVFNTFIGLIMSFRLNSAFSQWRAGVVAVGSVQETARSLVSSGCAFASIINIKKNENKGTGQDENNAIPRDVVERTYFFTELRRLVFLYIAIVFHDCREVDGIDRMLECEVLTRGEYDELRACGCEEHNNSNTANWDPDCYMGMMNGNPQWKRATIVELWLKRLVVVAVERNIISAPNASALHAKIAQLPVLYTHISQIANIPIPFNYMQYLQLVILGYLLLYTFVIVDHSEYYTPIWVFGWSLFLFAADQVAMEIECPFGLDSNDIDLEQRLLQIEEELTALVRSQYYFITSGKEDWEPKKKWKYCVTGTFDKDGKPTSLISPSRRGNMMRRLSLHQGQIPHSTEMVWKTESLPDINEFTALIAQQRNTNIYGSRLQTTLGV